jgi:hydrogenase-4 component E
MTEPALWALVVLGLAEVVVRRRSMGVALVAAQSLVLGALAFDTADGTSGLIVAGAILAVRGVALPLLLGRAIARTREPRRIASDRTALGRLVLAVAAVIAAAALVPAFGLTSAGAEHATVALLVLGILIAMLRGSVVFQAIGFLVAENGVYLATLSVGAGLPAIIELGLLADLVLAVAVAAAFGARIHERFGTSDTTLMRSLRD